MKKLILIFVLCFYNLQALDSNSADDSPSRILAKKIVKSLKISPLYEKEALSYLTDDFSSFLENGWFYEYNNNNSLSSTKVENSPVQFANITITNNNRITIYTYIYFPSEKQIQVMRRQLIPAAKDTVLELFEEMKSNDKYKINNETDNYAVYASKTTTSRTTYLVKDKSAMIAYTSLYTYSLGSKK